MTTVPLTSITSWDEAFVNYSVPEIRVLNDDLRALATAKKTQLRDLVGNRYRDMLKTADIIVSMDSVVAQTDTALSGLVTHGGSSSLAWEAHERCFARFVDALVPGGDLTTRNNNKLAVTPNHGARRKHLQNTAVSQLLTASLSFIKRRLNSPDLGSEDHGFLVIARSLGLAQMLSNKSTNPELRSLHSQFDEILIALLLEGRGPIDAVSSSTSNTLFLAYAHLHRLAPASVLERVLKARLEYIETKLRQSPAPTILPTLLTLVASTIAIAQRAFAKNSVPHAIQKQTDVYALLDVPELADDIELKISKYRAWLPDSVRSERAFPAECLEGITRSTKTAQYLKTQLHQFANGAVEIFAKYTPKLVSSVSSLASLVDLYKSVFEAARDTASIRNLSSTDGKSFYTDVFVPAWTSSFYSAIETTVTQLLAQEPVLRSIHSKLLRSADEQNATSVHTDSLFSADFAADLLASRRGYAYAESLFDALADYASGSRGLIRPVAHEYRDWLATVSATKAQVDAFGRLKTHLALSFGMDLDSGLDDFDDDDMGDAWRTAERQSITKIHEAAARHVAQTLAAVHEDMLSEIRSLLSKTGPCVGAILVLIRSTLLFARDFETVPDTDASAVAARLKAVDTLSLDLFEHLARALTSESEVPALKVKEHIIADSGLWADPSVPDGPSLGILQYLTKLVDRISGTVGRDTLIWGHEEGAKIVRQAVGEAILNRLQGVYEEIQKVKEEPKETPKEVSEGEPKEESEEDHKEESEEDHKEESEDGHKEEPLEESDDSKEESKQTETKSKESEIQAEPNKETVSIEPSSSLDQYTQALLQLAADTYYVSALFGRPDDSGPAAVYLDVLAHDARSGSVVSTNMTAIARYAREQVSRTRILYLPLAL